MVKKVLAVIFYACSIFLENTYAVNYNPDHHWDLIRLESGSFLYLPFPAVYFKPPNYFILPLGILISIWELLVILVLVFKYKIGPFACLILFALANFTLIYVLRCSEARNLLEGQIPVFFSNLIQLR